MSKKVIKKATKKMNEFSARGSRCPICGAMFRHGCDHSVKQAQDRLLQNYIRAIAEDTKL